MKEQKQLVLPVLAPLILGILHVLLMLKVRAIWQQSVDLMGAVAGPSANAAASVVKWVDFPMSFLAEMILELVASSKESLVSAVLSQFELRSFADLFLWVYWPLLLVLGTLQWIMIGVGVGRLASRLKRRASAAPTRMTS